MPADWCTTRRVNGKIVPFKEEFYDDPDLAFIITLRNNMDMLSTMQ
jgi:hypothetical protein